MEDRSRERRGLLQNKEDRHSARSKTTTYQSLKPTKCNGLVTGSKRTRTLYVTTRIWISTY